jgi:microcystin-dependent protein
LKNGSVTEPKLDTESVSERTIQPGAVTKDKVPNDELDGDKILFENDEYVRWKKADTTPIGILRLSDDDDTELKAVSDILKIVDETDTEIFRVSSTVIKPLSTAQNQDIGEDAVRFRDLYLSGDIDLGGTINDVDIENLEDRVDDLESSILLPGMIMMWGESFSAPTGWLVCDGAEVSESTYANLFATIGTAFNDGTEAAGNFRLPDFRQRFPIGQASSGTASGWGYIAGRGGSINHSHTVYGHYHQYSTADGSALNIALSGQHNTTVAGSITGSIGNNNSGWNPTTNISHDHSNASLPNHTHSMNHNHPSHVTYSVDLSHTHDHDSEDERWADMNVSPSTSGTNKLYYRKVEPGGHTGTRQKVTEDANWGSDSHSHNFDIPWHNGNTGNPSSASIDIPALGTTNKELNGTTHTHSHSLGFSGVTHTDGEHLHNSSSFSGNIGNVNSGNNGNTNETTSNNNPPYQTITFIIKA